MQRSAASGLTERDRSPAAKRDPALQIVRPNGASTVLLCPNDRGLEHLVHLLRHSSD
jgi:hypothetical protein